MSILETKLREFLKSEHRLSGDDLGDDRELFSTGLLDSFAVVELVAFLEKQRGIRVKASVLTLDNFDTIAGRTEYVSARS